MQESWVRIPVRKIPLRRKSTHSSKVFALGNPVTEDPGQTHSPPSQRVRHLLSYWAPSEDMRLKRIFRDSGLSHRSEDSVWSTPGSRSPGLWLWEIVMPSLQACACVGLEGPLSRSGMGTVFSNPEHVHPLAHQSFTRSHPSLRAGLQQLRSGEPSAS